MKKLDLKSSGVFATVYFDISIGNQPQGRIEFELSSETPLTSENFRALCTGEKGPCVTTPLKQLWYKNTIIHSVIPGFIIHGGDIIKANGSGGESIYGAKFNDENFSHSHSQAGVLSMSNIGPNTNNSQFFITLDDYPHLDDQYVAFGQVVKGLDFLKIINKYGSVKGTPRANITITDCGQIGY
ncbi:peptidyl-prolyl cis-trans isomerase [Stylonychia lemnae]|uniref:Peptidyl-prolyl cis-trans isomerase n=1 Tax=Stylonychia lemnae TaxID=5949 RepID=A0A078AC12_STYLE|nr:peptidyl-prolyl cis-trans isomerase [Stylonychia lemnae]|eukprot:CDW79830.1 peptidyl-prolyl cis-trans isomerase [Stylonychia lemnae]